jgi:hypothetical protein
MKLGEWQAPGDQDARMNNGRTQECSAQERTTKARLSRENDSETERSAAHAGACTPRLVRARFHLTQVHN